MYKLIDAAIARYRTVALLLAFILLAGWSVYTTIPKESSPDVKIPILYIGVALEGISPEDGERLLLRPLEKKLSGLESLKRMTSNATEGFASIVLEFEAGFDSEKAIRNVRVKVDEAKPDFPQDAQEPTITEVNFSLFPVVNVILTGDVPQRTLITLARDMKDKIETIGNVLEAKLAGNREEVVEIVVDPVKLEGYGLSLQEVFARVQGNHVLVPAGEIEEQQGRYSIKLPGLIENLADLRHVPVKVGPNVVVTIGDVAQIRRTFKDPKNIARVNGKPAVALGVSKRLGANIIETVAEVRELVEREKAFWPKGVELVYSQDISNETRDMLAELENGLLLAALLVLIVMIAVIGTRGALLVLLAVPGSFLFGILCLGAAGMTLNIVVLFSLILALGMLVDAAIVVCEYADRLMIDGIPPSEAYPRAAKRMLWPIVAATLTTKVVFLPLLFWPGIVGEFMVYMPITLIVVLVGSLLMAMIFIPTLGAKLGRMAKVDPHVAREVLAAENGRFEELGSLSRGYVRWLDRVLSWPGKFVLMMCGLLVVIYFIFGTAGPGFEFFPDIEPSNASVQVRARGNLSIYEKDALVHAVEQRIMDTKDVRVFYSQSGKIEVQNAPADLIGQVQLEFIDWRDRRRADVVLEEVKQRTADIPGIIVETAKQEGGPTSGKPVQVEFSARTPELLPKAVEQFRAAMEQVGGFVNVEDDRPLPEIEWELMPDREKAGLYNVDVLNLGNVVKLVTNGIKTGEYRPDDAEDEIDMVVRFPPEYRNLDQLNRLRVPTAKGLMPVTQFVERQAQQKVSNITRVDGRRVMTVKADLAPGVLADTKVRELRYWLEANPMDPSVAVTFRGEDEEQQKNAVFLSNAFMIALFAMTLLMVTQFNSIFDALIVMSAVILSTGGVLLGLLVTWQPFGVVMCGVGIIALAGIVVNNNILFIDMFNHLRQDGVEFRRALLLTGAQRLRAILLTASVTALGLLPMTFGMSINFFTPEVTFGAPSSQWWNQLSTAIVGGLTFTTVLTLFFTPCLLMLGHRFGQRPRRYRKSITPLQEPPHGH